MAFIGVRASESLSRNEYDYVSLGEKHKGQYSCNPILEWNSSELYSYIYMRNLYLNKAYKKGNRRAGCLVCPRAAERNEYMARVCYPNEFDSLMNNIREVYAHNFQSEKKLDEFIRNGGWKARKNGRDLPFELNYKEKSDARSFYIIIDNPKTDWRQWIKTIGVIKNDRSPYIIDFRGDEYKFEVKENDKHIELKYDVSLAKKAPLFTKLLKNVFRKTACCIGCKECEADCHNGMLHMKNGNVIVDDGCMHCSQCHKVDKGCLVYKSLEMPKGGTRMGKTQSLNCFSHHAPKMEWMEQYFAFKNEFKEKNISDEVVRFYSGMLNEIFLCLWYQDVRIVIGAFRINNVTSTEFSHVYDNLTPENKKILSEKECLEYYSSLPVYPLGDIRDYLILLGFLFDMNLEEIYSEELHKQVTENQLELVRKSAEDTAYETFRVEQYTFYYENKIMNLVSQGDLELLKSGLAEMGTRDTAIIHFTKELHGVSNQARTSLIRCILQHINLKIYDTIKVTELAKQFYLSESALRRRFKEEVGISINEYVNQRKIEESKMMLQSGVPVGEIARRLSFYDLSHYYRTFKKYTGMTPQYFRDTNVVA